MKKIVFFLFICLSPLFLYADDEIIVEIYYGSNKPEKEVLTNYKDGDTALDVLSKVADVKTKRVGEFKFIRSIDGVKSKPKKVGWFYSIDGVHADKTASSYILKGVKKMRWEFMADNCLQ